MAESIRIRYKVKVVADEVGVCTPRADDPLAANWKEAIDTSFLADQLLSQTSMRPGIAYNKGGTEIRLHKLPVLSELVVTDNNKSEKKANKQKLITVGVEVLEGLRTC